MNRLDPRLNAKLDPLQTWLIAAALTGASLSQVALAGAEPPVFGDGFEDLQVACADPLIQPEGWNRLNKTWVQAFTWPNGNNVPVYANSGGFPTPLTANKGGYTVISFVPNANEVVSLTWDQPQISQATGYLSPSPGHLFLSISPCPGDFRPTDFGAGDDGFLELGCRKGPSNFGGFTFHTLANPSNESICRLEAGQTYYLNLIAADPNDGLQLGEHTCQSETKNHCDVAAKQAPTQ